MEHLWGVYVFKQSQRRRLPRRASRRTENLPMIQDKNNEPLQVQPGMGPPGRSPKKT